MCWHLCVDHWGFFVAIFSGTHIFNGRIIAVGVACSILHKEDSYTNPQASLYTHACS